MRVVVAEQWSILRSGIRTVLTQGGHAVARTAGSAAETLEALRSSPAVELVVVGEIDRPTECVLDELAREVPGIRSLAIVDNPTRSLIDALLTAGASGILDRSADGPELVDAVDRIPRGERVLSNPVIDRLVGATGQGGDLSHRRHLVQTAVDGVELTGREREILGCLATGGTNRDIASQLCIGEATVKSHLSSTFVKLGVANRQQALLRAAELGVVDVASWQ